MNYVYHYHLITEQGERALHIDGVLELNRHIRSPEDYAFVRQQLAEKSGIEERSMILANISFLNCYEAGDAEHV